MKFPDAVVICMTMKEASDLLVHLIVCNHMDCIADEHKATLQPFIDKLMIRIVNTREFMKNED